MKRHRSGSFFALCFVVALGGVGVAACGGDDPTPDAGDDVTDDAGGEVTPDVAPDVPDETGGPDVPETGGPDVPETGGPDVPDADDADVGDPPPTVEAPVGADGGSVTLELPGDGGSVTLDIPAGALGDDVTVTITAVEADTVAGLSEEFEVDTLVFVFGPTGTVFSEPVTVTLPYDGPTAGRTIYWTALGDETVFEPQLTTFAEGTATTAVTHFSIGFIGRPADGLCETGDDCDGGAACVAERCVEPVADMDGWLDGLTFGTVTTFEIATAASPCCFDLTGDGNVDNRAGALIDAWDAVPDVDSIESMLEDFLRYNAAQALIGFRGLPESLTGHADLAFLFGFNDIDLDGLPDHDLDARIAGDGTYRVDARTLGDFGAQIQFPTTILTAGQFSTVASDFSVNLPIYQDCTFRFHETERRPSGARCRAEDTHDLVLHDVRIAGTVALDGEALSSVDGEQPGIQLGAAVRAEDIAGFMNALYVDNCNCAAGMDPDDDLVVVTSTETGIRVACDDRFVGENLDLSACSPAQTMCFGIPEVCNAVSLLGDLADVDTTGDSRADSFSIGVRVGIAPAAFGGDRGNVQPPPERCETDEDEDGDGRVSCDDPYCWDDTNCGALGHSEWCRNGRDDDGDGLVDCDDPACNGNRACVDEEESEEE